MRLIFINYCHFLCFVSLFFIPKYIIFALKLDKFIMANYGFNQYALKMTFQMRNKNENKESMLN